MKNSTLNGIPSPIPTEIIRLFTTLDEHGALGEDPRNHLYWGKFVSALNAKYNDLIGGIIIFSFQKPEEDRISFSFMLYPTGPVFKGDSLIPESKFGIILEVFKIHTGKTLIDFVKI